MSSPCRTTAFPFLIATVFILLLSIPAVTGGPTAEIAPPPPTPPVVIHTDGGIIIDGAEPAIYGHTLAPLNFSHLTGVPVATQPAARGSYPGQYDLRDLGKVSPVKDQGNYGSCWSFGATSSLESSMMPGITPDYSEKNLVNRNYWDTGPDDGGHTLISGGYFTAWLGPVNESTDPYPTGTWNYVSPDGPVAAHVQEILWIPSRPEYGPEVSAPDRATMIANMKWAITNYGVLDSSFYYDDAYYRWATDSYYCPLSGYYANHEVSIVGWDDTYSRSNFATNPGADGAWLMKNSWGTSWGDGGYAWVSYYDAVMGADSTIFTGSPATNYGKNYQFDPAGCSAWMGQYGGTNPEAWGANVFDATGSDTLGAVSFYTTDVNTTYTVRIYRNPAPAPAGGTPVAEQSGTFTIPGYHTVPLSSPVTVSSGQTFSVVIHLTNGGSYGYPLAMEYPGTIGGSYPITASSGDSYYSFDGTSWTDITSTYTNTNLCIKAFTGFTPPAPQVTSISPTSGYQNRTVAFTLNGNYFQDGAVVNFTNSAYPPRNLTASLATIAQTKITGSIVIPYNAPAGPWDIVVTTPGGGQGTPRVGAFTVNSWPQSTISSVSPTGSYRNRTVSFTLNGNYFQDFAVVNFTNSAYPPRNLTASLTTITQTKITGSLTIPYDAPTGPWDIIVTTPEGGQGIPETGAFTVNSWPQSTISSVSPNNSYRNKTVSFTLNGNYFQDGAVVNFTNSAYSKRNLTASLTTITQIKITGSLTIPNDAPTGPWDIIVTTPEGGQGIPETGAFTVNPWPKPTVSSISPTTGYRNRTVSFTLNGNYFQDGAVVNFTNSTYPKGNLTASIATITTTMITGSLTIPYDVPTGKWDIIVTTPEGGQGLPKTGAFTVNPWPKPTVSSISPITGYRNRTVSFTLTGNNFQGGATVNFTNTTYPQGNLTASLTTITQTKITGSVNIPSDAPSGKWDIVVTTPEGGPGTPKIGAFTVNPWPKPTVTTISPNKGYRNTTVSFTLTGNNFQGGATVNFTNSTYPQGNLTASLTTITQTKITGSVNIPSDAPSGKWDIVVTTPEGGRGTPKIGAFTVIAWLRPTVTSVSPASGYPNTTVSFKVYGNNFQAGTVLNFTNATYPSRNLTTAISSVTTTMVTGSVTIPYDVLAGKWDITVTTPDGGQGIPKVGAFSMRAWQNPVISYFSPGSRPHGTTLSFTLTGNYFQPGSLVNLTNSTNPAMNMSANVTSVSMTKIMGTVDIPSDRAGKFGVEVRCPDGKVASKANAFIVT